MKKILALLGVVLLFWSCAVQSVTQGSSQPKAIKEDLASQNSFMFRGKTRSELFEAAKTALTSCQYNIKTADQESGLLTATGNSNGADESLAPQVSILVFTNAKETSGVQIYYSQPGQTGDLSAASKKAIEEILTALQNILK
jgi:hypothetical protein